MVATATAAKFVKEKKNIIQSMVAAHIISKYAKNVDVRLVNEILRIQKSGRIYTSSQNNQ